MNNATSDFAGLTLTHRQVAEERRKERCQRQWLPLDDHEDPAPNTRALWGALAVYAVVMLCVVMLARYLVLRGVA